MHEKLMTPHRTRRGTRMRQTTLLVAAAAALAALVGCAPSPAPEAPPAEAGALSAALEAPPQEFESDGSMGFSERGAQVTAVGEEVELWGPPQAPEPGQWFTVTAIEPVAASECPDIPGVSTAPENGRFVAVDMTIENGAAYDLAQQGYYAGSAQQWDFVAEDGTAYNDVDTLPGFYCTGEQPFIDMKPGRTYSGTVLVDLPESTGWLIFGQSQFAGPGYEYRIDTAG